MSQPRQTLSLVFPAFNEVEGAEEIVDFYREIRGLHSDLHIELVVVDDGSTDGTADAIRSLLVEDDVARIIQLSRNFGSHAAVTAGLAHASGDAVVTLSADRQEPIAAVGQFIDEWRAGADIVWGLRSVRATKKGVADGFAAAFSRIYQATSDLSAYPREGPSQVLLVRAVIDAINAMPELNRNVLAMAAWTGFDQRKIFFEQLPRPHGTSKWTSKRKMKLVVDSFVEFSHAPLEWLAWAGLITGFIGFLALVAALVLIFTPASGGSGTALICGLILGVGGMILVGMGVLGEYTWRAGDDARNRPVFLVRSIYDSTNASRTPTTE